MPSTDAVARAMHRDGMKRDPAAARVLREHSREIAEVKDMLGDFADHARQHEAHGHAAEYDQAWADLESALDLIDSVIRTLEGDEPEDDPRAAAAEAVSWARTALDDPEAIMAEGHVLTSDAEAKSFAIGKLDEAISLLGGGDDD